MRMKVTRAPEEVEVSLTGDDVDFITLRRLYQMIGLTAPERYGRGGHFIRDGKIFYTWEESGGSHSWFEERELRVATELDMQVLAVIKAIGTAARSKG